MSSEDKLYSESDDMIGVFLIGSNDSSQSGRVVVSADKGNVFDGWTKVGLLFRTTTEGHRVSLAITSRRHVEIWAYRKRRDIAFI